MNEAQIGLLLAGALIGGIVTFIACAVWAYRAMGDGE